MAATKRLFALILCLCLCLSMLPAAAAEDIEIIDTEESEPDLVSVVDTLRSDSEQAEQDAFPPADEINTASVVINTKNFPDDSFRSYIEETFDIDGNKILSGEEIAAATYISLNDSNIESLEGIEHLRALRTLKAMNNELKEINLSKNSSLVEVYCGSNILNSLVVSGNPKLRKLDCGGNELNKLDVSRCPSLEILNCSGNSMSTLDVSYCPSLTTLYCDDNIISNLIISNNPVISTLICNSNYLESLDISRCPRLIDAVKNGIYTVDDDSSCTYSCGDPFLRLDLKTELIMDAHDIQIGDYIYFGSFISDDEEGKQKWQIIDIDGDSVMLYYAGTYTAEYDATMHAQTVTVSYTRYNTYGSCSWEYSDVRQWLNTRGCIASLQDAEFDYSTSSGIVNLDWNSSENSNYIDRKGFLSHSYFSPEEFGLLETVEHESLIPRTESGEPGVMDTSFSGSYEEIEAIYDGAEKRMTSDKMFLLNILEFKKLVVDSGLSAYRLPNGNSLGSFWLRDSVETNFAGFYYYYGTNCMTAGNGQIGSNQADLDCGVRPACCLDFSKVKEISGTGTFNDPIVLRKLDESLSDSVVTDYSGYFRFRPSEDKDKTRDSVGTCYYNDNYFAESSWNYNHNLAKASLCMAMASMNTLEITPSEEKVDAREYSFNNSDPSYALEYTPAKNITTLMHNCGFNNIAVNDDYLITTNYCGLNDGNNIGVCIGSKEIEGDSTLLAVVIRSGGYGDEWIGNFNIYNPNGSLNHIGFNLAANKAIDFIKDYLYENEIKGKIKIWISGYSRGAATADLAAAKIAEGALGNVCSLDLTDLYAYCFETPQGTTIAETASRYNGIWNITNLIDPVTKVAMSKWGYTVFGHRVILPCLYVDASAYYQYKSKVLSKFNSYTGKNEADLPHIPLQSYRLNDVTNIASLVLQSDSSSATQYMQKRVHDYIKDNNTFEASPLESILGVVLVVIGVNSPVIMNFVTSLPTIIIAHYPELTLAWMESIPAEAVSSAGVIRYSYSNCPVDLAVYDQNGELQLKIINNEVFMEDGAYIEAIVDEDGQKVICIPQNVVLNIEILATGDGEFNYSVQDYDPLIGKVVRTVNYYDVDICEGDNLVAEISTAEEGEYLLFGDNEAQILPSEDLSGDEVEYYQINISASGDGTVSGSTMKARGEFAQVAAVPNENALFLGWYQGEDLISKEAIYRFRVTEDIDLTAKFESFCLDCTKIALPTGSNTKILSNIQSSDYSIVWTSSNTTVATVDGNGVVTAHKYGKALITASVSETDVSATCEVQTLFYDVADPSVYYFKHVYWAAENEITKGYNLEYFAPQEECTREQMMTFLWRLAGQPEPTTTTSKFSDVKKGAYYYKAVLWGVEKGITNGYSTGPNAGKFGVGLPCTREQAMTFLWRMAGKPNPKSTSNKFADVKSSDYYYKAVLWASENKIANGYSSGEYAGKYGVGLPCLREHMVTFLSKYASKFMS